MKARPPNILRSVTLGSSFNSSRMRPASFSSYAMSPFYQRLACMTMRRPKGGGVSGRWGTTQSTSRKRLGAWLGNWPLEIGEVDDGEALHELARVLEQAVEGGAEVGAAAAGHAHLFEEELGGEAGFVVGDGGVGLHETDLVDAFGGGHRGDGAEKAR